MVDASQIPLHHRRWTVKLSETWDVLGPFPIHAREQQFLSPSFPLRLPDVIDYNKTWPSSYADGGKVSWTKFQSDANGDLKISFPNIRWSILRATEGWAALQYHSVLRTSITVFPPHGISTEEPRLHVRLAQGSFFCVIPTKVPEHIRSGPLVPTWYSGNIYELEQASPQIIHLPALPSLTDPTDYDLFVSGDYEIRLFGDPRAYSASDTPVLSINVAVEVENPVEKVVRDPSQDVTCDFVDGFAFGEAFGFGLRSVDGWWTVKNVTLASDQDGSILLHLLRETRIAPTQTRIVPLRIIQSKQFLAKELHVNVTVVSDASTPTLISLSFPIHNHSRWTSLNFKPIKASYFFAESMATSFVVLPPCQPNDGESRPPILALHGAGVKILEQSFWADSLPRQRHSWVIIPTGRTSWGLDWHGPSAQDAWASVDALVAILDSNSSWHSWSLTKGTPVILVGHSNGGQGAWYLASKYPDRVLAVVSAAGYIKSQSYVPLTMSRSQHFIDPSLRAILDTALTGDDNDLFMSNLIDTPILAIHGGRDDNVPAWHSREIFSLLKTWNPNANVTYREYSGQPHWWPSVLDNEEVQAFVDAAILGSKSGNKSRSRKFTLTVAIPAESGALHGWKIESVEAPGRLARLHIQDKDGVVSVQTTNVHAFSIDLRKHGISKLRLNGHQINIPREVTGKIWLPKLGNTWNQDAVEYQLSGRMQTVLATAAPLLLIVPDDIPAHELSIALRIAHDLNVHHKLDAEIILSSEATRRGKENRLSTGNIVVIRDPQSSFCQWCFNQKISAFDISITPPQLNGRPLDDPSQGIIFLHQHPTYPQANMLFMLGDQSGIERVSRLFPIRTGVTVPDWLVVGAYADEVGAGAITGAGVWGREWKWDSRGCWLH